MVVYCFRVTIQTCSPFIHLNFFVSTNLMILCPSRHENRLTLVHDSNMVKEGWFFREYVTCRVLGEDNTECVTFLFLRSRYSLRSRSLNNVCLPIFRFSEALTFFYLNRFFSKIVFCLGSKKNAFSGHYDLFCLE